MKTFMLLFQIFVSIGLIVSILAQAKGAGLGSAFGGNSAGYRSKRGVEKLLYRGTMVLAALFLLSSIVNLLLR